MEGNNICIKEQLNEKLWITRKCRINAETRLLANANFLNFMNIYYSIFISVISIVSLVSKNNGLSIISVSLSVALTIFIAFSSSLDYKGKAEKMKRNYLDISDLETKLKYIDADNTTEIEKIEHEYNKLLDNVENHLEYDYSKHIKENDSSKYAGVIKRIFIIHTLETWLFRIVMSIFPILLTFIIIKYNR